MALQNAPKDKSTKREALGLVLVNTVWQLEQKVKLQNEFTSGPIVPGVHYSGDKKGRRRGVG